MMDRVVGMETLDAGAGEHQCTGSIAASAEEVPDLMRWCEKNSTIREMCSDLALEM